jgi:hypothetical protein
MQELLTSGENTLLFVVKIGLWLFLLIYVVFAATLIKQIRIMTETLTTGLEIYLKAAGFLHFAFALFVLILSVIVL